MLQGFKDFISRGNVIDLAVGVIIGGAFTPIVSALTDKILMPLIAAIFGKPSFDHVLEFSINGSLVQPGILITAVVNFLIIAAALYFCIVMPMNKLNEKRKGKPESAAPVPADDVALLTEIRDLLAAK
ncbi:large conductance mechanosensitive channel protein MscL [Arcanobacterium hippocoleae]